MEGMANEVAEAIIKGNREDVISAVKKALEEGIDPLSIITEGLTVGLNVVGAKFESGEYFLPDMMLAAEAANRAMGILEPLLGGGENAKPRMGRVVIGTVEGDVHEIGKNIVIVMMKSAGFEVFDLGVDVPSARFVEVAREKDADIVGISALMTTTVQKQREVIELLKAEHLRDRVKVIVGGAPLTEEWAARIGADAYAPDAITGVRIAKTLLGLAAS